MNPGARFNTHGRTTRLVAHPIRNLEALPLPLLIVYLAAQVDQSRVSSLCPADTNRLSMPRMPAIVNSREFVGITSSGCTTTIALIRR